MSKYTMQIEPGTMPDTWAWEIAKPDGQPHAWGATTKTKEALERDLKKTLKRLNEHTASWNGCDVKKRQKHRNKAPKPPGRTSIFSRSDDQVIIDHYPAEGRKGIVDRLGGKFTKDQIYARANRLGVHAERYTKRSRWAA